MSDVLIRVPTQSDGAAVHALMKANPPLEVNSEYCYLLMCSHFAQTCTVAEQDGRLIGFQTGYRRPDAPNTLFVWQIAVGSEGRGKGVGKRMVEHLLGRFPAVEYLEQTVTKSNNASRALFSSVARSYRAELRESLMFGEERFSDGSHEAEYLLRIGPLSEIRVESHIKANKNQGVT